MSIGTGGGMLPTDTNTSFKHLVIHPESRLHLPAYPENLSAAVGSPHRSLGVLSDLWAARDRTANAAIVRIGK